MDNPDFKMKLSGNTPILTVVFNAHAIDIVFIMGAGIDLEVHLEIVKHIFTISTATTVHMKDWDSGQQGMLPFVNGILTALAA